METSHTEQFLLPSDHDNVLTQILQTVRDNNKNLDDDFKILINKINNKSREVETSRRLFMVAETNHDEQKELVKVLKDR